MMGQTKFKITPRTLAGRLTQWIILTLLMTMIATAGIIYGFSKGAMAEEAANRYQGFMEMTNAKLEGVLTVVELAVANNTEEVADHLDRPDRLDGVMKSIVEGNPYVTGCGLALEPDYYSRYGRWHERYALRHDDGHVEVTQIGGPAHDYFQAEWYRTAVRQGKGHWTNPYLDEAGGKMPLLTYSLPVRDSSGKVAGVLGADVSLQWLASQLHDIDLKNNQYHRGDSARGDGTGGIYSFIISHDGSFIVHPNQDHILARNFYQLAGQTADTLDDHVCAELRAGRSGSVEMDVDGVPSFLYYSPLENAGWSMAIVVPRQTFFHRANLVGSVILILMAVGLLVAFLICRSAIRRITSPLARFAASADEVARGHFDTPLPTITTGDEIGLLHDSFEAMQQSLGQYVEDLKQQTASQAAMDNELKIASGIQMSMLPKVYPPYPDRDDIDIYGRLLPAKAVGGDLYDYYLRDEKLFFCIGDVSGKGVPASLLMTVTCFLFRTISSHEDSPAMVVTAINEALVANNETNMFITLFVGVLDLSSGHLQYCNAGHVPPMLIGAGIGKLPCDTNIPVGLQSGWNFILQEEEIQQQTTILLYTDGLTEAEDASHHQFGEPRIHRVVRQLLDIRQHNPQHLVDTVVDEVNAFTGTAVPSDDLAMLAVQFTRRAGVRYRRVIILDNDVRQVATLATFVNEVSKAVGLDDAAEMQLNLAIEEAVVNVMKYAYPSGTRGEVRIEAQVQDEQLQLIISDSGVAFDPMDRAAVDTTRGMHERGIGGLGIHLVREMMDHVSYERLGGRNVLTLIKKINTTT